MGTGYGGAPAAARGAAPASARARRAWPPGLPVPLTPLVGRRREVAEVVRLVTAHRLVTLAGAGGAGKTRVAIEAGAAASADFADRVNLVDLSAVPDSAALLGAVATAFGIEERELAHLEGRLVRVLRPQRRLVILDNCEHLSGACAALAALLLRSCPELTILVTSRESLALAGEITWRVPPLAFPSRGESLRLQELESFDAVTLFRARAQAARPGFAIGDADIGAVASICRQLDGIPLALELAAARVAAMSVGEIADRLTGCLELLAGSGGGPARHQTLRASIEWSYQLLAEDQRALLHRLAVFSAGWTLDAAESVCTDASVGARRAARLLAALVDKSLVQAEWSAAGTRYRLLETIRLYAFERLLESGELARLRARHAEYFAEMGERSEAALLGPEQAQWANRLDAERDNLRAARWWCAEDRARGGLGLRLASGLWEYWHMRGMLREGAEWLSDALDQAVSPAAPRAAALNGLGVLLSISGAHHRGADCFAESIRFYEQAEDVRGQARAWVHLGNARAIGGDHDGSAEAFDRGLALARQSGDPWQLAFAIYLSGYAATIWGDTALAAAHMSECAEMFARIGDRRAVGYAKVVLGDCLVRDGDWAKALATLREGMHIFEALPERWGLLYGTGLLADATAAVGDWPRVALLLGVVDTLSERLGGQILPHLQQAIDTVAAKTSRQLGRAASAHRETGRVIGRSDGIAAALWPDQSAARPRRPGWDLPLTRREREVAGLIAEGLTNRQVGERLVIAERTVDTHVGRILAKLGCTNRAQVAAIVAARQTGASRQVL